MRHQTRKARAAWTDPDAPPLQLCNHPECALEAPYRAPRSREGAGRYWFCLDHVRAYNKAWNFFEGMSENEILAYQRDDVTGHRPTWPMGSNGRTHERVKPSASNDVFGMFNKARRGQRPDEGSHAAPTSHDPELNRALDIMNLTLPTHRDDVKTRYKELVKRHHPDANGGDKRAEEHLKLINQAYSYLMAADCL